MKRVWVAWGWPRGRSVGWAAIAALGAAAAVAWWGGPEAAAMEQPIRFNHAQHGGNNVTCIVCHADFRTSAEAGMPGAATCRRCHEDVIHVSAEKRKLQAYADSGQEIPWRRVYDLPDHVYFSHRRHVVFGGIECARCHGDVAGQTEPLTAPLARLEMADCIDCHARQQEFTSLADVNECTRCHR